MAINQGYQPIVLSLAQVAEMWSVSPRTVERWISSNEFPKPAKQGSGSFWHYETLNLWARLQLLQANPDLASEVAQMDKTPLHPQPESSLVKKDRRRRSTPSDPDQKPFQPVTVTRRKGDTV
ncbi:DNA-binding protein [Bremerella cremea]|uniref:Helix-turn-helix domain-containing protein n=1 Tax=Blastopirellula marina TaxID=124 RepID=A0A2S8FZH7_9BACT|nr:MULTISPECIES: helix-turn-helix domain-containing protein [Pirellulaceae]PQO37588.1 hypothetical protein C5Y83_06485 [Blastopirellula marina]RCS49975.1 DNA-binding protein [Bremerella cremea]